MISISTGEERLAPLILSSEGLPARDRFDMWREELMLRVIRVDVDVPDRRNFRTDLHVLKLPSIAVIERRSTPSVVTRGKDLVRDGDDALVFSFPWENVTQWTSLDDEARFGPGEAIITALDRVGAFRAPLAGRSLSIRVSRDRALGFLPPAESLLHRPLRLEDSSVAILRAYLDALRAAPEGLSASMALLAEHQIQELLAHIFDPAGDLARAETYGGVRAARLRAALADIAAHLAAPDLSAATVAGRLGVSERYVQRLLEGTGRSFSVYVREQRLKLAYRLLRDPRRADQRISEIAEDAGFNDLSHFNRTFRQRFGHTPSEAREMTRRG